MEEYINKLPSDGEWYSDGNEAFLEVAKDLHKSGLSDGEIKVIFSKLYSAVANEYGE